MFPLVSCSYLFQYLLCFVHRKGQWTKEMIMENKNIQQRNWRVTLYQLYPILPSIALFLKELIKINALYPGYFTWVFESCLRSAVNKFSPDIWYVCCLKNCFQCQGCCKFKDDLRNKQDIKLYSAFNTKKCSCVFPDGKGITASAVIFSKPIKNPLI